MPGSKARRAWSLYETLTGQTLDLPNTTRGPYVAALNEDVQFTASRINSPRHRVIDNLLGTGAFSVTVRRTAALEALRSADLPGWARRLLREYDPALLARAITFLYTSETLSSFRIEREQPDKARERRFVRALRDTRRFDPTSGDALRALQTLIVDGPPLTGGWRTEQVFAGETVGLREGDVHFVTPRPQDVPALMEGWRAMTARLLADGTLDPVVVAAAVSFAFVFVHPLPDGNGRLHRYLIHHVLERRHFTPEGAIFPVSASMLRDRREYDTALETFSEPLMEHVAYDLDPEDLSVTVGGVTARHRAWRNQGRWFLGRLQVWAEQLRKPEFGHLR